MNKIEQLIKELCPNGVQKFKLSEICDSIYSGGTPSTSIKEYWENGTIQWINSGEVHKKHIFKVDSKITQKGYDNSSAKMVPKGSVVVALAGQGITRGSVALTHSLLCTNQSLASLVPNQKLLNSYYLFYYMEGQYQNLRILSSGDGTRGGLNLKMLNNYEIPLPPLQIQQAIVEILNKFEAIRTNLQNELATRRKQYEHYREQLLTFGEDVKRVKLGDIGAFIRGNGLQKSDFVECGYPCIHYGQIHTTYGFSTTRTVSFVTESFAVKLKKAHYGDLIIATTSEDVDACCKAVVWLGKTDVAISGDSYIFSHKQIPNYIGYCFKSETFAMQKKYVATGTKVVRVSGESMSKFTIPLPSLEVQKSIVAKLDKFEALITNIEQELDLRTKQYEYYREKLLTFNS